MKQRTCEICEEGTVTELIVENYVPLKFWGNCTVCGFDYADSEQIDWNANQIKKYFKEKHER